MDKQLKQLEEFYNIELYKSQKEAIKYMLKDYLIELGTGEGKTFAILGYLTLILPKLKEKNEKIVLVLSNPYLCKRDYEFGKDYLESLGYKVGLRLENTKKFTYSEYDVIYVVQEVVVFDYMRGLDVPLDIVIIDEIDYTLIECGISSLGVSNEFNINPNISLYEFAFDFIESFNGIYRIEEDFEKDFVNDIIYDFVYNSKEVYLTEKGINKALKVFNTIDNLKYVYFSLEAKYIYKKDIDYKVENGKICNINKFNARMSKETQFGYGIQTALEVLNNSEISTITKFSSKMYYSIFFNKFKKILGVSGTVGEYNYYFQTIFRKKIKKIKSTFKNNTIKYKPKYFESDKERLQEIRKILSKNKDKPILIICYNDLEANKIYKHLKNEFSVNVLLNNNLHQEVEVVNKAGNFNNITITTPLLGRGTDIKNEEENLLIIKNGYGKYNAIDRQVFGRTGRQGRKGFIYLLSSAEDLFFEESRKKIKNKKNIDKYSKDIQKNNLSILEKNLIEKHYLELYLQYLGNYLKEEIIRRENIKKEENKILLNYVFNRFWLVLLEENRFKHNKRLIEFKDLITENEKEAEYFIEKNIILYRNYLKNMNKIKL